jgi:hypothetical protein
MSGTRRTLLEGDRRRLALDVFNRGHGPTIVRKRCEETPGRGGDRSTPLSSSVRSPSCPAMGRASTPLLRVEVEDVDGRVEPGHDDGARGRGEGDRLTP